MSEPVRVQLSRRKGWRMPPNTVKVDRSTVYGNPFTITSAMSWLAVDEEEGRFWTVVWFRDWMTGRVDHGVGKPPPDISALRGKNLGCWCREGKLCHADVLLDLANSTPPRPEGE